MKALITGTSGCDKDRYLEEVSDLAFKQGRQLNILHVGDVMSQVSAEVGYEITKETVLDIEDSRQMSLRMSAYERIASVIERQPEIDHMINTHSSFLWRGRLITALTSQVVDRLSPDTFVTIVDNAHTVRKRLHADPQWSREGLSLKDILMWREQEIAYTKNEATRLKKPHYVIARKHPASTLLDLVLKRDVKKIYLSYPMTYMSVQGFAEVKKIAEELRKHFVVFDPSTITESLLEGDLRRAVLEAEREGKPTPEKVLIQDEDESQEIPAQEIEDALTNIRGQIVTRDYSLIDQSDMVVILMTRNVMSVGVICEMVYGDTHGKAVYVVSPLFHRKPSPFMSYHADEVFETTDELLGHLESKHVRN